MARRRFLFLAGPIGHPESEARKKEFLRSLAEISEDLPEPVIIHANFVGDEAKTAVELFLSSGQKIDAVVAANDLMAFGALRALFEAGYDVPRDVSVTGYDDTENCRYSIPPLTTIRQPTHELGCEAFQRLALDIGLEAKVSIPSLADNPPSISFVIRDSCGCSRPEVEQKTPVIAEPRDSSEILAELSRSVNRELGFGRNPALLPSPVGLDNSSRERAALIVTEGEIRYQSNLRIAAERRIGILRDLNSSLVSSFDITDILAVLARGTRDLGITGCWLALFRLVGRNTRLGPAAFGIDGRAGSYSGAVRTPVSHDRIASRGIAGALGVVYLRASVFRHRASRVYHFHRRFRGTQRF